MPSKVACRQDDSDEEDDDEGSESEEGDYDDDSDDEDAVEVKEEEDLASDQFMVDEVVTEGLPEGEGVPTKVSSLKNMLTSHAHPLFSSNESSAKWALSSFKLRMRKNALSRELHTVL